MTPDTEYGISKFTITSDGSTNPTMRIAGLGELRRGGFDAGRDRPRTDADAGPGSQSVVPLALARREPAPVHANDFQLDGARVLQSHIANRRACAVGEIREGGLEILEASSFLPLNELISAARGMPALPNT